MLVRKGRIGGSNAREKDMVGGVEWTRGIDRQPQRHYRNYPLWRPVRRPLGDDELRIVAVGRETQRERESMHMALRR